MHSLFVVFCRIKKFMSTSPTPLEIQTLCEKYYVTKFEDVLSNFLIGTNLGCIRTEKLSPEQLFQIAKECKYPDEILLKKRVQELYLDNPSLSTQQWIPFSLAQHFITQLFRNANMKQELLSKIDSISKKSENKMFQFGFLTRKQASALLSSLAPSMTNEEVKGIVDELDDQGLGYCSIEELVDTSFMNRLLV